MTNHSTTLTEDLYNTADVKRVREYLIKEQGLKCALTGLPTAIRDYHTDHAHDQEQLVRGAIHKHANMLLGKIENLQVRYLKHWYKGSLSDFLRACAEYLDRPPDKRWRHTGWIRRIGIMFNKLPEPAKKKVLLELGLTNTGTNAAERKKLFQSTVLSKKYGYNALRDIIQKHIS